MAETPHPSSERALRRVRTGGRGGWLGQLAVIAGWVAVVAMIGVAATGAALSAPPAALAVAVTVLPYLYLLLFVLLVAVAFLFPARRAVLLQIVIVAGVAAWLWMPRTAQQPAPTDGLHLRMASWNVRRLWGGPQDGGDATRCVVDALKAENPDVITLLEVSAEDVDTLSKALDLACVHHPYTADGDRKEGGLATCTRGDTVKLGPGSGQRFLDGDDWYYVSAEAHAGDRTFNVLAVHLFPYRTVARTIGKALGGLSEGDTEPILRSGRAGELVAKSQADHSAAMLARVERFSDPTLIGGDFNSTSDSALHVSLRRKLTDAWRRGGSWYGPTVFLFDLLPLRIDYVYSTSQFHTVGTWVPPVGCSDHRPVVTDLVLSP